jgi:hypothetical protein
MGAGRRGASQASPPPRNFFKKIKIENLFLKIILLT